MIDAVCCSITTRSFHVIEIMLQLHSDLRRRLSEREHAHRVTVAEGERLSAAVVVYESKKYIGGSRGYLPLLRRTATGLL